MSIFGVGLGFAPQQITPGRIGNKSCALWLRADSNIELTSGNVSGWTSLASGSIRFHQTGSTRPMYNESDDEFNGHPTLTFNGSSTWLECYKGIADGTGDGMTFFCVFNDATTAATANSDILAGRDSDRSSDVIFAHNANDNGVGIFTNVDSWQLASKRVNQPQFVTWVVDYSAQICEVYRDGKKVGETPWSNTVTGLTGDHSSGGSATIGVYRLPASGQYMNGRMAECALWNEKLTDDNIADLHRYARERYQIDFTPLSLSGSILWLRSDKGVSVVLSGAVSVVEQWQDQAKNWVFYQTGSRDMPLFSSSLPELNNRPSVYCESNHSFMLLDQSAAFFNSLTNAHLFHVTVPTDLQSGKSDLVMTFNGGLLQYYTNNSTGQRGIYDGTGHRTVAGTSTHIPQYNAYLLDATETSASFYTNGAFLGKAAYDGTMTVTTNVSGTISQFEGATSFGTHHAEIVMFERVLNGYESGSLNEYFAERYRI